MSGEVYTVNFTDVQTAAYLLRFTDVLKLNCAFQLDNLELPDVLAKGERITCVAIKRYVC